MNLNNGEHQPYMKPNNNPIYINTKSNHPPAVMRAVPRGINKRLSQISSNKEVFDKCKEPYQKALNNSGFSYKLEYEENEETTTNRNEKKKRSRNITWFNPPFNKQVTTHIGKQFLQIIEESFPIGHKLRKIFNRNTVKVSYSCMPNIKNIIDQKNKKILNNNQTEQNTKNCNCRKNEECPINGKCREKNIVYQATVTTGTKTETYVGLTDNEFKIRYANHKQSFSKKILKNSTELSKYIWTLKNNNQEYKIKWKIIGRANTYTNKSKECNLCLLEKYFIICQKEKATLNKKSELISTCRHRKKYLLSSN